MQELQRKGARVLQQMQSREAAWRAGDLVRVRGERWTVEGGQVHAGCELLRLAGSGRTNRGRRLGLLCPFDRPLRIEADGRHVRVGFRRWLHALRAVMAGATPYGRLQSAASARIDLLAWQLEPALAVVGGRASRVLLADEVGLGKTVQAGLIAAELQARGSATRTLVLTPAGLRDQWRSELSERFALETTVVDAALVRRTVSQLAAGTNPWSTWPVIITSLDFAKRPEVLRALEPFTWDLLIVDEAHSCAMAPERASAIRRLAARSRRVVLATATPHAGNDVAFNTLCALGSASRQEPIVMFRRSRTAVGLPSGRRVHLLHVTCSDAEREMHRLLERYTRAVWTARSGTSDARLAMVVLRKRALSSAVSLLRSLERRANALFDLPESAGQLSLPFAGVADADEQTLEDAEPVGWLAAPGMEPRRERDWLKRLIAAARLAATHESKTARLSRLLARSREPAIVFTEYRDTARWLALALDRWGPVVSLHGGMARHERREVEREFVTGTARVLVATDAAGEGLNLHHRCRLVVNLELPWNPMRLEQRVGRIDRLGQRRWPHAVHLVARGTAEEQVVERLVVRQARARQSVGGVADAVGRPHSSVDEHQIAAAVFEGTVLAPNADVASEPRPRLPYVTLDLRTLATEEVERLREVRRCLPRFAGAVATPFGHRTLVATLPKRRVRRLRPVHQLVLRPGLVCVFIAPVMNSSGEAIERFSVCLHLALPAPHGGPFDSTLHAAVTAPALVAHVTALARDRAAVLLPLHEAALAAAIDRERAIARGFERTSSLVQPGMFDRRALRLHERQQQASAAEERDRQLGAPNEDEAARRITLAAPELALVLVVPPRE